MAPPNFAGLGGATARTRSWAWSTPTRYAARRLRLELRRPTLWVGVGVGALLAWAGTHLEILGVDDRPERSWGVILSTAETLGILLVLAARLRGADLAGSDGWSETLKASSLGSGGLCAAETAAAAGAAWVGAAVCAALLLVYSTHKGPPLGAVWGWVAALLVELAVLSAWLSLAATWLGRLPALGVSILVVALGRTGGLGALEALLPTPAPLPPGPPSVMGLAASVAATLGLTALSARVPAETRTLD